MTLKVLAIGALGNVAFPIISELANYQNVKIRAIVQQLPPTDEEKLKNFNYLAIKGVEFLKGSITDKQSLKEVS